MRTAGGRLVTCLLLLAGSGEGPAAAQAPGERGDLAIRARAILRRHCLECHREGNLPAGTTLKILDHSDLTRPDRPVPVVQPGNPDGSQLLHLVADGSMPPADRRKLSGEEIKVLRGWVEAGAPSFPPQFDDAFVLGAIRADLEKARPDPRTTRYVSLHAPLADDSGNVVSLAAQRRDFFAALNSLTAQVPAQAVAIEGTEAVYRIDLKQLGWDRPLFREVKGEGEEEVLAPASEARFNVFDVLLLEYPFGKLYAREGEGWAPDPAGSFNDLIEKFLVPAGQVRPVAYVRGDWLTWYLTQGEAHEELRRLLGRQGGKPARVETPAPVALREEPLP
ncbi:MAG TPA: c-type cytochrome domain-containing protein, partial [Gemmataceae bacterium]